MESKRSLQVVATLLLLVINNVMADQASTPSNQFDTMVGQTKVAIQNITEHVRTMLGLPEASSNDIVIDQLLVNQTRILKEQIGNFVKDIQTAATDKDGFLAPVIAKLNETANSLQSAELQKQSKQLQDVVTQSMTTIMDQISKVVTEVKNESKPSGTIYDTLSKTAQEFVNITRTFEKKLHETMDHNHQH